MLGTSLRNRRGFVVVVTSFVFLTLALWIGSGSSVVRRRWALASYRPRPHAFNQEHPITRLIRAADERHTKLLQGETKGVKDAAAAYRKARGRHPPPRWDRYVKWCEEHGVVMVEEFYDSMYRDLGPFWGISPETMRQFPRDWMNVISIRNGTTYRKKDEPFTFIDWMGKWELGIRQIPAEDLPDVDLAFNGEDESKIFVPWETIDQANRRGDAERRDPMTSAPTVRDFEDREPPAEYRTDAADRKSYSWANVPLDESLWWTAREACAPGSQARVTRAETDLRDTVSWPDPERLAHLNDGFVTNWTSSKSVCDNPYLRSLHGAIIAMKGRTATEPNMTTKAITRDLVPILSGCKLHGLGADILVPPGVQMAAQNELSAAMFEFDPSNRTRWEDKRSAVIWRGMASGGENNETNWTRFHRHRFVAATNQSLYAMHERKRYDRLPWHAPSGKLTYNFPLAPLSYGLAYSDAKDPASAIQTWADRWQDTGFTHLLCWPPVSQMVGNNQNCSYDGKYYTVLEPTEPHVKFNYKFIPDIDGFAFSGRYRGLLLSNSVPLKATIYDLWDDDRLLPWKHFVPMENTNMDWYPIMEYFLGYSPLENEGVATPERERPAHDAEARAIAEGGAQWADRVIRHEDQVAWFFRLILELARLSDDRRLEMGFDGDLQI